jgi:glycosyltransferase involved in cell wall biosynthesis
MIVANKGILVCIPAFDEGKIIRKFVQECHKYSASVVVCDDGSTDNTAEEAEAGGAKVIKHWENIGKGAALKSLFKFAKNMNTDIVVTIDGDGQFLPKEIEKITKPILEGKADIVIGYRFEDDNSIPSYRKFGNKLLDKMTNMASEVSFRDTQSGFRAYSAKAVQQLSFQTDGFGADSEILIDASRKGLKIVEEEVTVIYDTGYETSTKNPISHSADVVYPLIELIALKSPLKYLGIPGVALTALGIMCTILVLVTFNSTRYFSIPWTLAGIGSIVVGLLLVLMSVVLFSISRAIRREYRY